MRKLYFLLAMLLGCAATMRAQNNWMQYLPDDAYVVDVSIPGSHDAATGNGWATGYGTTGASNGTTQDIDIDAQWKLGVRAFDLRPKVNGSRLAVNHGSLQTRLYFDDAIKKLCGFLKDNPKEFIVVHLLYATGFESDKDKYKTMLLDLLNRDEVKEYLINFRKDLTVRDMRGKMLLISRDPYDTTPVGGFFNGWGNGVYWNISISGPNNNSAPLNVQDISATYNLKDDKNQAIRQLLDYSTKHIATTANDVVWAFNLPSGYTDNESGFLATSTSNGYRENATYTHPTFIDYLKENPAGPTGVVLMDYVGVDESKGYASYLQSSTIYKTCGLELLNALIENNWRYLPKFNAEGKTISVPFYTYKKTGWTCTTGNTFQVNTWSTEGITDGSGMVTPFFENWLNRGGKLGNGEIYYTLYECKKGLYKVTIRTRLLNESGGEVSGASIFANESSIALTNGNACTNGFSSNYSVVGTVGDNGELKFGFKIKDATFNWISFTGVDVEYLGEDEAAFDGGDLILDENAKYNKDLKAAYNVAQEAFKNEPSIETYNAMSKAYRDAETSIEAYKALATAMEDANKLYEDAKEDASEESKAEYERIIAEVKGNYENGEYLDSEIEERVIPMIYAALAAMKGANGGEIDMTSYIVNPSFETGDMTGWSLLYGGSQDTGVKPQSDAKYATEGCDGKYLFNTWWKGVPITQTIKGLPNGRYRLDAFVASDGATIYLTANDGHNEGTETGGSYPSKDVFQEASYEFDVTNGVAVIGVVGSADGTAGVHKSYQADGYWWYKVDNFRLAYLGSYLSNIAEPFSGSGEVEAGKWYAYDVDAIGYYDFSATEGIEYTTTDALVNNVKSKSLTDTKVRLSSGTLFFKSATKQSLTIARQTGTVTITETKYAEYVTPFDADFALTAGITAYKVTKATKAGTVLVEIKTAPEGTAVILYGSAADYTINQATSTVAAIKDNLLMPGGNKKGDGASVYVLGSDNEQVGFVLAEEGDDIGAGQVYLVIEDTDAATFIPFGMTEDGGNGEGDGNGEGEGDGNDDEGDNNGNGEGDGNDDEGDNNGNGEGDGDGDDEDGKGNAIESINAENAAPVIYTLSGQRVANMTKGIYIVNGKKVVVK